MPLLLQPWGMDDSSDFYMLVQSHTPLLRVVDRSQGGFLPKIASSALYLIGWSGH